MWRKWVLNNWQPYLVPRFAHAARALEGPNAPAGAAWVVVVVHDHDGEEDEEDEEEAFPHDPEIPFSSLAAALFSLYPVWCLSWKCFHI